MVDLDSSPTKLIEVVRIGKQLLMTRGALTTFSLLMMWQNILQLSLYCLWESFRACPH